MSLTLYAPPFSSYCWKVLIGLYENGTPFAYRNLEEPGAFNQHVADFLHAVETGRWPSRDPRAMVSAILGK